MSSPLKGSPKRVQEALATAGFANRVVTMPDSTRTSADAARACGCTVAQIAKSLVLRAKKSDRPVLVIASGANRVDERKVTAALGEPVDRADAGFVRERTGFAIGGVAPLAHREPLPIVIDRDLLQYDEIWAAAGAPNAVFRLTPDELRKMTGGTVEEVAP